MKRDLFHVEQAARLEGMRSRPAMSAADHFAACLALALFCVLPFGFLVYLLVTAW